MYWHRLKTKTKWRKRVCALWQLVLNIPKNMLILIFLVSYVLAGLVCVEADIKCLRTTWELDHDNYETLNKTLQLYHPYLKSENGILPGETYQGKLYFNVCVIHDYIMPYHLLSSRDMGQIVYNHKRVVKGLGYIDYYRVRVKG